jgi:hypothetical protein
MQHGPFDQLTIQYKRPTQEQHFLVGTCCLTFPSLLTGTKLETKQTLTWNVKIDHAMIGTAKLVIKYFLEKMVYSAIRELVWKWSLDCHISSYKWDNQSATWNKVRTTEHEESHTLFQQSNLTSIKCCFYGLSPSPTKHACLHTAVTDISVHYTSHTNWNTVYHWA